MKKQTMRWIAMVLCICLCIGHMTPLHAEDTITASFSPGTLVVEESDTDQTVTVKLQLAETMTVHAFSYNLSCSEDIVISSAYFNGVNVLTPPGDNLDTAYRLLYSYNPSSAVSTDHLGEITFLIPGGTAPGSYPISLSLPEYGGGVYDGEETHEFSAQPFTLTVTEKSTSAPGSYTAALSGQATATIGDQIHFSVTVTGDKFSSAYYQLQYDSDKLEFISAEGQSYSDNGGYITVVDYGNDRETPYTYEIVFEAIGNGDTVVSLENASFSTAAGAETGDLIPAAITKAEAAVNIAKNTFAVQLSEIFSGDSQATAGETYYFKPTDPVHYNYTQVTATMNGQSCDVNLEDDGRYSIESVTGALEISGQRIPVTYTVMFKTTTGVELPETDTATYGKEYSFTLPTEEHYSFSVDSIFCGKTELEYEIRDERVILAGSSIQGDIVIILKQERNDADVSAEGPGADDLTYLTTAEQGKAFSVKLTVDERYNYEVSATVNGTAVELDQNGNIYTIPAGQVKAGTTIVFTVVKTLKTDFFSVREYLNFDGTTVWLVTNEVEKQAESLYTYRGTDMFWSAKYQAYCTLVVADNMSTVTAAGLGLREGTPVSVDYEMDVNKSGNLDVNDAQLVYNLYNAMYRDFTDTVTVEKALRADVNGDKSVDVTDACAIVNKILGD